MPLRKKTIEVIRPAKTLDMNPRDEGHIKVRLIHLLIYLSAVICPK